MTTWMLLAACVALCATHIPAVHSEMVIGANSSGHHWGATIGDNGAASGVLPLYSGFRRAAGGVSADAVTAQALFEQFEPHSVWSGPLCADSDQLTPRLLFNVTDVLLERPELGDGLAGVARAFTLHDSHLYFLHYGSYQGEDSMTHIFQVRVLQSCADCGVDPYSDSQPGLALLYTVTCSKVVVEFSEEASYESVDEYYLGSVLKVVQEKDSDTLDLYFQIGKLSGDDGSTQMLLYHATSEGGHELVHTQDIAARYNKFDQRVLGAVDYRDDLLCWTTADRVLCRYDGDVKLVLAPAAALTKGICHGSAANHLADISGVAILQGGESRVIVFGCSPQTPDVQGAGIIRILADGEVDVQPFTADTQQLSAASLVVVQDMPATCSFTPQPVLCVRLEHTTSAPSTAAPTTHTDPTQPPHTDHDEDSHPETDPEVDTEPSGEQEPGDNVINDGGNNKAVSGTDGNTGTWSCRPTCGLLSVVLMIAMSLLLS